MPEAAVGGPRYALSIDGQTVVVQSPSGGYAMGQVVTNDLGPDGVASRHIGSVTFPNLQVQVNLGVGSPVATWVSAFVKGAPVTKDGSLIELDEHNRTKSSLAFTGAEIVGFTIPGFDGASAATNSFMLDIAIKKSILRPGDNSLIQLQPTPKPVSASNFRLTIADLPTSHVSSIAPLSFRLKGRTALPSDLVLTLSNQDIGPWRAWADDFLVKGNHTDDKEKQGKIEVLTPDLQHALATLELNHVGIFELTFARDAATGRHRASLYFESARLSFT